MPIIIPLLAPGCAGGTFAAVFAPLHVECFAEDADLHEGPDVETDAVVEVGLPAEGLIGEGLPAYEDVVGRLAFQDQ